jgi:hypothetical protein
MVKQVNTSYLDSTILNTIQPSQSTNPIVEVIEPIPEEVTSGNTTINNILQANNIYISTINSPVTNLAESFNSTYLYTSLPYGAQEYINIGASPNDGTGDPLRVAFQKVNNNFSNLFSTATVNTEAVTVGTTPDQVILEYPADIFLQGTIQIRSYDPASIDMQNIILSASINNLGNNVKFTAYATVFDGNAVCTYDMDVFDGSVRVLVTPLLNTSINHFISYQITNPTAVEGPAIGLDGYPLGDIMGTELDEELITEGI